MLSLTDDDGLNLNETTLADVLHENGYMNYMLGKWHLGNYMLSYDYNIITYCKLLSMHCKL